MILNEKSHQLNKFSGLRIPLCNIVNEALSAALVSLEHRSQDRSHLISFLCLQNLITGDFLPFQSVFADGHP
jgi:hypothetical protein